MSIPFDDEDEFLVVLVNDDDQCSLWPSELKPPVGWTRTGPLGSRSECLSWIDTHLDGFAA